MGLGLFWVPISLLLKTKLLVAILTGFPLVWNKIKLVFDVFTAILLSLNQLDNFCSSRIALFIRDGRWVSVARQVVSSAKGNVNKSVESGRSLI